MGACCGKGASPKDPDKVPYGSAGKSEAKKTPKQSSVPGKKQTTAGVTDAAVTSNDATPAEHQVGAELQGSDAVVDKVDAIYVPGWLIRWHTHMIVGCLGYQDISTKVFLILDI